MTDRFLKAKHWQIFLLTTGIPLITQVIILTLMIANIKDQRNLDPFMMLNFTKYIPIIMLLFIAIFFGWFWSVAIGLQKKVPENAKMKVNRFKIFFFITLVYILAFLVFLIAMMNTAFSPSPEPNSAVIGGLFVVILPLHLFSMFGMFHSLYFVAKTFKTVELQRPVKFEDFVAEFFMIWFLPIGIWIIQPKINKMIDE